MTKPIDWAVKAAKNGVPEMMYEVGMAYAPAPEGITQDLPASGPKAAYWLQRVAASDNKLAPMAAEDLAALYATGAGTLTADAAKAYLWLNWATRGDLDQQRLAEKIQAVVERLTDAERKAADTEFARWTEAGRAPEPEGDEPQ
ncbi:hypothetical protein LJC26_05040 [Desulfovibrio sp. OttesenSCG-928-O18]|nr:hypothetical protein [Desulfovibrio sp. OttesenSCG-928-O18]